MNLHSRPGSYLLIHVTKNQVTRQIECAKVEIVPHESGEGDPRLFMVDIYDFCAAGIIEEIERTPQPGDRIDIAGLKVQIVWPSDSFGEGFICMQNSVGSDFLWRYYKLKFWMGLRLQKIKSRTIITLGVWNLATYNRSRIPQWRDIYLIERVRGWMKKIWPN